MRNQDFCYWLQGYFEISQQPMLTTEKIAATQSMLSNITEPLGEFTQWLSDVLNYLYAQKSNTKLIEVFCPEIQNRLNDVFYHVIDNSYDSELSREESKLIHDGSPIHDK